MTPEQSRLVNLAVGLINKTKPINSAPKEDNSLDERQKRFLDIVGKDLQEDEREQLETKIKSNPEVMGNYQKRNMLKDGKTNRLLNSRHFAFNVDYPSRGFKDVIAK
ncbi:hypothetical protein [Formosa sp. L2A11]|uniref:hypothetical protein n=1 Tax=Formosa sp. L2A11 TaxID=2686363 RepID=UPI00131BB716|nr:hypothetical protein [Formosa sp. L2A11]